MSTRLSIESASIETLGVTIMSEEDPTDGDVDFSLVAHEATSPSSWTAGTWDAGVTWTASTQRARAITPTIGASGADIELTEGEFYKLYVRVNDGPVKLAATIRVT